MPLPWLIGAAVVAGVVAIAKAVKDDDSSSYSYDSGDEERRRQEREASRQRKREGLASKVANLEKDRLDEARELLARAGETLERRPKTTSGLNTKAFESAILSKCHATSEYARGVSEMLGLPELCHKDFTPKERGEFLINLQMLEGLYGPAPFSSEEPRDLGEIRKVVSRLNRLQTLKQQLEQQG